MESSTSKETIWKRGAGRDKRKLHYFIAVAEELHFNRAAEKLNMSQPPLSQQIQALKKEIGVKRLERNTRQVRLTPAGGLMIDLMQAFRGRFPQIQLTLREMTSA
ncbi:LysR family transcriptional regulator [Paenibacillus alvei]|uniref:LysR family transcriptional regulator n=1 Tax=Paenibacillus alvei TaxID=44250 RepID=UPI003D281BD0